MFKYKYTLIACCLIIIIYFLEIKYPLLISEKTKTYQNNIYTRNNSPIWNNEIEDTRIKTIEIPDNYSSWAVLFYKSAQKQIWVVNSYDFSNWYYWNWWYPPDNIWVCSDVIRRAFEDNNIDFKKNIDIDMKKNLSLYNTNFDSNINFRRVKNINIYLSRNSKKLTNEIIPEDEKNLVEWQAWDIVIFDQLPSSKLWHIWIISDRRTPSWVPYMLDNHWYWVKISITPLERPTKIIGHYRYF